MRTSSGIGISFGGSTNNHLEIKFKWFTILLGRLPRIVEMDGNPGEIEVVNAREGATAELSGSVLRLACPGGIGHVQFRLRSATRLTVAIAISNCEGLDVTIGEITKERGDFDVRQGPQEAIFELDVPANQDVRVQWIDYYR